MIFLAFLLASPLGEPNPTMVSEFGKACVASRTKAALTSALSTDGWKAYATIAESHLEHEIAAVTPMLEAQGLASDYTIYSLDGRGRHLELALSETKKPVSGNRKLIGCSIYDFEAVQPVDSPTIDAFAPNIVGQKGMLQDVQVEKWDSPFGQGSGMRAVFVPSLSPMKSLIGFGGMMLGTHFLDGTD
jgi:hypothetical protein